MQRLASIFALAGLCALLAAGARAEDKPMSTPVAQKELPEGETPKIQCSGHNACIVICRDNAQHCGIRSGHGCFSSDPPCL